MTETPIEYLDDGQKNRVRSLVRFLYDMQQLRIQSGNRTSATEDYLTDGDREFFSRMNDGMETLEKDALKEVARSLKGVPIYRTWLKAQKGVGPTLAGLLISELDMGGCRYCRRHHSLCVETDCPARADSKKVAPGPCEIGFSTASALWRYCGLGVDRTGRAERRVKGEKAHFNPWLKAKLGHVMGECLLRARSPWKQFYDDYKHRKQNQRVEVCQGCKGTGKYKSTDKDVADAHAPRPGSTCRNCEGTGGPAPWGASDKHRHTAAMRYMVKQFLLEYWRQSRQLEGLPIPPTYAEAYLGRKHGDHGGSLPPELPV